MVKDKIIEYRSKGEAHLYVAVAKSDGVVTTKEKARAPSIAFKCKSLFDAMNLHSEVKEQLFKYTKDIFENNSFRSWSADDHLNEAIKLLKQAKESGDLSVCHVAEKCESTLQDLAVIDGYLLKESKFLKKIKLLLSSLK
jgi:hypothetical protein